MTDDETPFSPAPHPDLSHEDAQVRPGETSPYRPEYDPPEVDSEPLRDLLLRVKHHWKQVTHPKNDKAWPVLEDALFWWKGELEACIENGHRGPDGIFPGQLREVCRYLGPVDGVSEVLRAEQAIGQRFISDGPVEADAPMEACHEMKAQPQRPATRGLDEVIANAKEAQENLGRIPNEHRRELEEWEAQLDSMAKTFPDSLASQCLAEVRSLLGRSEPEPAGARITERVYRKMTNALAMFEDKDSWGRTSDGLPIWLLDFHRRKIVHEVLREARAELGEGEAR